MFQGTSTSFQLSNGTKQGADCINVTVEERYTYEQIATRVNELAIPFREKYSCQKGDRIAICCRNWPEFVSVYWVSSSALLPGTGRLGDRYLIYLTQAIQVLGCIVVSVNA